MDIVYCGVPSSVKMSQQAQQTQSVKSVSDEKPYYTQGGGRRGCKELILDYDRVWLSDILMASLLEFDTVMPEDVVLVVPDGFGNYYDVYESPIVVRKRELSDFINHSTNFSCDMFPVITLANVMRQASSAPNPDFRRTKVGWLKGTLSVSVEKPAAK